MDNQFSNIDQGFKDAFEHWEADYTPSEMHAQWKQVSQNVPSQVPHNAQPVHHLLQGSKAFSVLGVGAAVTTIGVLLYNIYIKPAGNSIANKGNEVTVQNTAKVNTENAENQAASGVSVQHDLQSSHNDGIVKYKSNPASRGNTGHGVISDAENINGKSNAPVNDGQNNNLNPGTKVTPASAGNNLNIDLSTRNNNNPIISKPKLIFSDTVICVGSGLSLRSTNLNVFNGSVVDWGESNSAAYYDNMWHVYSSPGLYHIKVKGNNVNEDKTIQVLNVPRASFTSNMVEDLGCEFNSMSDAAANLIWNFGDGSPSEQGSFVRHRYRDTGTYFVKMIASNSANCSDTIISTIKVRKLKEPITYNIFSPNADGENDDYIVDIDNEVYYELIITNKEGKIVFYSKDKNQHWNGTFENNGVACAEGGYFFKLRYKLQGQNAVKEKIGNIKLVR